MAVGGNGKGAKSSDDWGYLAACLVAEEHGMGAHMERILKAAGQDIQGGKPIMELNLENPLVKRLASIEDEEQAGDWAHLLFGQAVLSEGGQLDDPAGFVHRLNRLMLDMSA